jgi:hypothetical protein
MSKTLLKDSTKLRDALKSRWKELKLTQTAIQDDAKKHGQNITREAVNKYLKNPYSKGALNEHQLIWLAWRWYIPVTLNIGIPNNTNFKYEIPKYDEKKAIKLLEKIFPK